MKAIKDSVVTVHYTLKDTTGSVLDSSRDHEPLTYIHGHLMMIPGFELGLEGQEAGANLSFDVECANAYGDKQDEAIFEVPKDQFPTAETIEVGMKVNGQTDTGHVQTFTIVGITDTAYMLDGNHPLAGQNLHFDVEILSIRAATAEEIEHGHVHGEGGHVH